MDDDACRLCSEPIIWSPAATTGALIGLDPAPQPGPAAQLVALNPKSGLCRVLQRADLHMAQTWAQHGVTYHHEHRCEPWRGGAIS